MVAAAIDARDASAEIHCAFFLDSSADKLFISFSRGADIHIEDIGGTVVDFVFVKDGVLCRIHAADFGAEVNSFRRMAAADTVQEYDAFWFPAI